MVENVNGRKWKIKKVLTICRDSDRILTTGKTRPAMNAGKRMEERKMLSTKNYLATMKEWEKESREKAAANIYRQNI